MNESEPKQPDGLPETISDFLRIVVPKLESLGLPYYVTGSVASTFYSVARFTHDVDVVVRLEPHEADAFCQAFADDWFYIEPTAVRYAVQRREMFNVIMAESGFKLDVIVADHSSYSNSQFHRARRMTYRDSFSVMMASPEDIIVSKLRFYDLGGSAKHLNDIAKVVAANQGQLETEYIEGWANNWGVLDIWHRVLRDMNPEATEPPGGPRRDA